MKKFLEYIAIGVIGLFLLTILEINRLHSNQELIKEVNQTIKTELPPKFLDKYRDKDE